MSDEDRRWYSLDGNYHPSKARTLGAVHLRVGETSAARCRPRTTALNVEDGGWTRVEAERAGFQVCRQCEASA